MIEPNSWLSLKQPVWVFKNGIFIKAIVEHINGDIITNSLEDGTMIQAKKKDVFQRNPTNQDFDEDRFDLMDTDVLNEPQVLKTLKSRLQNLRIYTFVQNSLISVNPYHRLDALYSSTLKQFYNQNILQKQQNFRDYEPHIYSITAFMISQLQQRKSSQAIIISGESGSGKTEANKQCIRFLQYYLNQQNIGQNKLDKDIDKILLLSNPILQAFGNSKTIRNNNSSRFGKYLNISLNNKLQVKHIKIYNYLLQKSRIINRAQSEQNFHIFYQFVKNLPKIDKVKYHLINQQNKELTFQDFTYLQGKIGRYQSNPQVSFDKVKNSLQILYDKSSYDFVCRILAAILLLGNLTPYQHQNQDSCKIGSEEIFEKICDLLKIKKNILLNSLTCYTIKIGSQTLSKYFNYREVQELINSLSKILYEKLFQWIINQINLISHYQGNDTLINLGFLDIYGFEILQSNSLEQLFINYTNQRLHQIYLIKIFKEEYDIFQKQGLLQKYRSIDYIDNIKIIQLIDYENLSVFNLLDEWCSVASPDQASFITKLRYHFKKNQKFPINNFNLPSTIFVIRHSPKDIQYNVLGFRDKNKDLVRQQIKQAIRSSALPNLPVLFEQTSLEIDQNAKNHRIRKFLSSKFRKQMNTLIGEILNKCDLHFIRCVKSNNQKKPLYLDEEVVYNQICYLGILDTIKIKKMGYCIKIQYDTLDKRFKWLVRYYFAQPAFPKEITKKIKQFLTRFSEEQILYGKNKIFFKDYAYNILVKKYNTYLQNLHIQAHKIQKVWFAYKHYKKNRLRCQSIKKINHYLSVMIAHKNYNSLIRKLNVIQLIIRQKLQSMRALRKQKNIIVLQSYIKKLICQHKRQKHLQAITKIIQFFRRLKFRRIVNKFLLINQTKNLIIERAWMKIVIRNKYCIESYLLGFLTQISKKTEIATINLNTTFKLKVKSIKTIQTHLHTFLQYKYKNQILSQIAYLQRFLKTWLIRQKYNNLKRSAILIQRAYRQYYFNKKIAKQIFNQNFKSYIQELQNQNKSIQAFLYNNPSTDNLQLLYKNYLNKYKHKFSLFYIIIDFQSFIHLEDTYPDNSWLLNYFQVVKESFDKDNPIQSLEVGETFTIAATTNKLYIWGMNTNFNSLDRLVAIKSQNRIQKVVVFQNKIQIQHEQRKENVSTLKSTINRHFNLENGKVYQICYDIPKLIKISQQERVAQISCGNSHVILRTNSKKVYTFGNGRQGQLGQGNYISDETPKLLKIPQQYKNYLPIQISAAFTSSIVMLSNKKLLWFGTNGSIDKVNTPTLFDLKSKFQDFSTLEFSPLRIKCTWSKTLSIIGLTFISYNNQISNNQALRNKISDLIINKWQEDIDRINPPYHSSFSDYLEQCHVKLPINKISIQPEGKKVLKQMEQKVKSLYHDKLNQISFSDAHRGDFFK